METRTITMKNCLIMFILFLFAVLICSFTDGTEDGIPNKELIVKNKTSKSPLAVAESGH